MLADNIKKFRKRLNLSQEELARKAGITYSTLIKLESGVNKNPTVKTLQQLAGALEVSLDQLVEGELPSK
jgi:transcriptional regulator with XRE-family HTH domain